MKIPKIKKLLQFAPMVLLCLALVVVLILKVRIPTTSKEISVNIKEQTQSITDKQAESDQSPTAGKKKMSVTTNISKIEIAPVVDEKQQKYLYNEAVEAIINVDRIRNDDSTLPSDNAFSKKKDKQYWWDLINWFGKEVVEAKNDDFTLKNYLDANQIRTEVQLTEEQKDFAVSLEVPNSKTVTSSRGDFIQYEFDQSTVVQYQLKNNRLKENIIYNFKPTENYFYFNIDRADNLEIIPKSDGEIIIQTKDEPRHIVATVMAPTVVDRKGKVGKISLEYSENRYKYIIDQSWLDQANYPVVIDPTLQLGAVLYYTGGTVNVEWHGDGSDYRDTGVFLYKDEVSLYSPINQYLISNIDYQDCNPAVGVFQLCNKGTTSFNLGDQYIGQELKFGNKVYQSDIIYYTGPASRNPDNQVHASIVYEESFNAYIVRFLRNHPTKNGMFYGPSVDIWLTGGLSDSPPPIDPTPTTSPEPILSNLSCVSNSGQITVNFDTTGFGSAATYAIKFVGNGTQYLQSNNTLADTEVWKTKGEWGNNIRVTGLNAGTDYTVSISAKPDGTGTALAYGPTKNTTEICSQDTFNDSGQVCGDGIIQFPEECDDGNTNDGDGCDRNCTNEPAALTDPPTVDIKANGSDSPSTLPNNSTISLSWTSSNATSCTASGSWSGDKATSGSENQGPLTTGSYTYTIQCTNSAGSRSDSVTVKIKSPCDINYAYAQSDYAEVGTVTNHWYGTVCINRNLYIANGNTLTIDPGTVVKFYDRDATIYPNTDGWTIDNRGIINANGTADQPIYFTSYLDDSVGNDVSTGSGTPRKSTWRYIYMDGRQGASTGTFNYTTFRYGGSDNSYPMWIGYHNDQSPQRVRPIFRNCTFENNSVGGIYQIHADILVENISLKNNSGPAFYLHFAGDYNCDIEFLGNNNFAYNNQYNAVILYYDGWNGWQYFNRTLYNDLPYIIANPSEVNRTGMNIYSDITVNIESGAIIKTNMYINAYGTMNTIGNQYPTYFTSLKDDETGQELHPEWFSDGACRPHYPCDTNNDGNASTPAPGDWTRINFTVYQDNSSYQAAGLLDNCIVRYGGSRQYIDGGLNDGGYSNIYFKNHNNHGKISPTIKNSIIEKSLYSGISHNVSSPNLENLTIRNNNDAAITSQRMQDTTLNLSGNFDIHHNGINGVKYTYGGNYINTNRTFSNKVVHYFTPITHLYVSSGVTWTIEPGTIVKAQGVQFNISGNINAVATKEQPIYFTSYRDDQAGLESHPEWFENGICKTNYPCDTNNDGTTSLPARGDWIFFLFDANVVGPNFGNFNHAIFRYGGAGGDRDGMVKMLGFNANNKTEPTFFNSTFEYSQNHGIEIEGSNPTLTNPTINYNSRAAIMLYTLNSGNNVEFPASNQIEVHDNGVNGVETFGHCTISCSTSTIDNNRTWYNDLPYVISNTNDVRISTSVILNIEPGAIIKSKRIDSTEKFYIFGGLNAIGTADQPITFTSFYDDLAGTNGTCEAHQMCDTNNDGSATTPAKGNWHGLYFDSESASAPISNLDYVNVKYGNRAIEFKDFNDVGQTEPNLNHINISESLSDGVYINLSNPTLQNMSITNNNGSAIRLAGLVHGNNAILSGESFDVHDNAINGIHVDIDWGLWPLRGYVEQSTTFSNHLPYYIDTTGHTISINSGIILNVNPGTILKFESTTSDQRYINNYGTFNLNGTTENPIYLISGKDDTVGIETHPEWFENGICKSHYPCDTNNDGTATTPAKEDWGGVLYSGSSAGGKVYNATFRYGAGGTGNYDYELAFDGVTANTVEVKNSNFNFTNRGLYANNSKLNIHDNIFDSSSDYGVVINNPPTGFVFDRNEIAHFDTGIWITAASNGLTLSNNNIHDVLTGVLGQSITTNGVMMTGNYIDASNYFIHNNSSPFVSGSCASPSTSTTINACVANNWGSYPVSDYPAGKIYKNPGNILYNNYGVQLTAPNGGERWSPRSRHNIIWTTYNTGGNSRYADLYYSFDGGTNWTLISENIDHQGGVTIFGTYDWLIPDTVSAQTLVKVNIKDLNETIIASDVSNSYFVIGYGDPQLSDTISTAHTGRPAQHTILYTNDIANSSPISDGSLKFDLADEFDFTGLTLVDLSIRGGDVSWGVPTLDPITRSIIYSFSGNLSKNDGSIILTIGDTNLPLNPTLAGDYRLTAGIYQTTDGTGNPVEEVETLININDGLTIEVDIPTTLEFAINPLPSGSNVNGAATNVATAASAIDYGRVTGGENKIAAHELVFSTNCADGYLAQIKYSGPFSGPVAINDWAGTNSEPTVWLAPNNNGYFGYTTDNSTLKNGQANRFTAGGGNKWAGFTTDFNEVAAADEPVENQASKVGYRFNLANNFGISGVYQTEIMYLVTTSY